jgi:hypothetical protein
VDQRSCRIDEIRTQLHVQRRSLRHVIHVLSGDLRDGNVVDIDLVPPDEIQKQIEGSFVRF